MSADQPNTVKEDLFRNWVRSAKGLRFVKDGLKQFVSENIRDVYNNIATNIQNECNIQKLSCSKCTKEELLPGHVVKRSKCFHKGTCLCQHKNKQIKRKKCADNNACGRLYDYLIDEYNGSDPNIRNVDVGKWSTNPWEFAKGFINSPGYELVGSAETTDASGLLSICIKNKSIRGKLKDPTEFEKAREVRNAILHSGTMELTELEMNEYLKVLSRVLDDPELYGECLDTARKRLQQLPNDDMCPNCIHAMEASADALEALSSKKAEVIEQLEEQPESKECQQQLADILEKESLHNEKVNSKQKELMKTLTVVKTCVEKSTVSRESVKIRLANKNITVDPKLQKELDIRLETFPIDDLVGSSENGKDPDLIDKQEMTVEDQIAVVFHILVSPDMIDDRNDTVLIRFGSPEFGGWEELGHKLRFVRIVDGLTEYEYKINVDKFVLQRHGHYKYCVVTKAKKAKERYVWEHYYDCNDIKTSNRKLYVDKSKLNNKAEWHQYDGIVTSQKSSEGGAWNWVKTNILPGESGNEEIEHPAVVFARVFCPPLFKPDVDKGEITHIQSSIDGFESLLNGLRKVYYVDARCWNTEEDFKTNVCGRLLAPVIDAIAKSGAANKIIRAVSVVVTLDKLEIAPPASSIQALCRCMLLTPDPTKMTCVELDIIEKYFKKEVMKTALVGLVQKACGSNKDPSWMFCLPLIHFVDGICQPYALVKKDLSHAKTVPTWWGIAGLEKVVTRFKEQKGKWTLPIEKMLGILHPCFEMDIYLARSLVACLTVGELVNVIKDVHIPVEVCCASVLHWLRTPSSRGYLSGEDQNPSKCLTELSQRLQNYTPFFQELEASWWMSYKIASNLVEQVVLSDNETKVMDCVQIFLHCTTAFDKLLSKQDTKKKDGLFQEILQVAQHIVKWLNNHKTRSWSSHMDSYLQTWNMAFATTVHSEDIYLFWNDQITRSLTSTLHSKMSDRYFPQDFVGQYCRNVEKYNNAMQDCLTKLAFEAIENGYDYNYNSLSEYEKRRFGNLMSNLFERHWEETVGKEDKHVDERMLNMMITWSPVKQFIKNHYEVKSNKILSAKCKENLDVAVVVVKSQREAVCKGIVEVGKLKMIHQNVAMFADVVQMINYEDPTMKKQTTDIVTMRMIEKELFDKQVQQMTFFVHQCYLLPNVNTEEIGKVLAMAEEIDKHCVSEFCTPLMPGVDDTNPQITSFHGMETVLEIVPRLQQLQPSLVFEKMWKKQCRDEDRNCSSVVDVVQKIWTPVEKSWRAFSNQLRDGDITFQEFESMTKKATQNDNDRMYLEMKILGIPEEVARTRILQLNQNREIGACVHGAKVFLQVKENYKLEDSFALIGSIASHKEKNFQMKDFDDSLIKTCGFLKEITPEKARCIQAFVECGDLVQWLKESMKTSGQKELKVFVDLAMMSAGDEPINIAKVQCLHSAVIGYAPLIFELPIDCDDKHLLDLCRIVWKELEANSKLPDQLWDTNRELNWLQEIKKAHGSVEVTSLMQAEAINTDGIFTVGRKAMNLAKWTDLHNTVIDETVKLTVPEEEGKRQLKKYTFSQLQDLQSRLMLVVGKSDSKNVDVDRFTMIFDSITRLSSVYRKLCLSGCVLFNNWTASFLCTPDEKRPVCATLEFGQGDDFPKLKGRKKPNEQLEKMIPAIANFMETCLDEWLSYIKSKRKTYFHLNYFTIDQLVILQRELVKMGTEEEPSNLVYPLLSVVKEHCTPDDVKTAMAEAKKEVEDITSSKIQAEEDEKKEQEKEVKLETKEEAQRNAFVNEQIDGGYSEKLAIKAYAHASKDEIEICDVSSAILWIMDNDEDDDLDEGENTLEDVPDTGRANSHTTFTAWSNAKVSISSHIKDKVSNVKTQKESGIKPLIDTLKRLWETFLDSISSNISDYLSLEHLGLILEHLNKADTRSIQRSMPPGLMENEPNLIVCPAGEILNMTLTMYSCDKNQPLPQSDEVLLCTTNTTKEEVNIFWHRAFFDSGKTKKKVHCLVHADLLGFDVSEAAEQCLDEHLLDIRHDKDKCYRLVVICISDNEYTSNLVSSLDKYTRQFVSVNPKELQEYVTVKFTQPEQTVQGISPAASVDVGRLTARIIKSSRSGVGKTLYMMRREEELRQLNGGNKDVKFDRVTIPLQEKHININHVAQRLMEHVTSPDTVTTRIFHIDISHEVQEGIDFFLFNLLILNCLMDNTGYVWSRCTTDLYLIEAMPIMIKENEQDEADWSFIHPIFNILPNVVCRSPQESETFYSKHTLADYRDTDQLFDEKQFASDTFNRPFQYLHRLEANKNFNDVMKNKEDTTKEKCLDVLLRNCGVQDPSWSELHHFVKFLNTQLVDFEQNAFVSAAASDVLPGFGKFVIRFLVQMSRDFSTRSLNMSEETFTLKSDKTVDEGGRDLSQFQMRRTWESSPHPYLFFNSDRFTFTFLGFNIERATGNLVDLRTKQVLEKAIMAQNLYDALVRNQAPIQEDFDSLPRGDKIRKLCFVMGKDMNNPDGTPRTPYDPDDTCELTTDNVKKIMAIYMRFRCDIPVIIMGETGCGKTRLIKFMCALQSPPGEKVQNMILMKVNGGTTNRDITRKVLHAEKIAKENSEKYGQMYTVLFFDEANTTESIGLIKEIMCDRTLEGKKLDLSENLKMVAACNPYRTHSDELIKKLEQAGLGYHVDADETTDKLGRVPMRRLVYRVQPLPQSMLTLVWDFGQLNTEVEDLYIRQMVKRYVRDQKLPNIAKLDEVVSKILTESQEYMRNQKDECSFVSLRDVDRVLTVMSWFYEGSKRQEPDSKGQRILFDAMDQMLNYTTDGQTVEKVDDVTRSLVLALGICYHACLKTRDQYRQHVAPYFHKPCQLLGGEHSMLREIDCCQDVFLDNIKLDKNIAKNMALKENVFMMVVCIELRIPLFLVGKPGSSKSLAKTIVSDAMQGNSAHYNLFKSLKKAQMVSFQCSPLSTPDGIVGTFRQCAQFQKDIDLDTFVSIVVLDEVGLAEDIPRMPLKTLHPLLEDGCQGDETPERHMKVAFIGISNWALDPAKMNRGILVQREIPDLVELTKSAEGICQTSADLADYITPLIEPLSRSYLEIFGQASKQMREFFGLRDFYSLVKMIYGFVERSKKCPTWFEMLHAIRRNFGGLDKIDPINLFKGHLVKVLSSSEEQEETDPDCSAYGLIQACLFDTNKMKSESRYLLLLTENYGALSIVQQQIFSQGSDIRPITIFGSSFRSDQEYTQVCRNINKIKVCMETGNTVILLNLENLYESLYDALNQYYMYFGGERYVDLGLGTHRVKCPVHKNFRLIVVAEKETVYKKFPIPLINRLEKHFLNSNTILNDRQRSIVKRLARWAKEFSQRNVMKAHQRYKATPTVDTEIGDVFIGYHQDTCSSIVLHVSGNGFQFNDTQVLKDSKFMLLWCATPESLVQIGKTNIPCEEQKELQKWYHERQSHYSLMEYLQFKLQEEKCERLVAQVVTHSKLLAGVHKNDISEVTGILVENILLLETLPSFDTEQQFSERIRKHLKQLHKDPSMMVIQCDSGDVNANLIACARYCVMDEYEQLRDQLLAPVHVVFIVQLPRKKGGCFTGFQCGIWHTAYIDYLYSEDLSMPQPHDMVGKTVGDIFLEATHHVQSGLDPHRTTHDEASDGHTPHSLSTTRDDNAETMNSEEGNIPAEQAASDEKVYSTKRLKVEGVVMLCIQPALASVKNREQNSNRETERVKLVMDCLHHTKSGENAKSFLEGLTVLIGKLLGEKDILFGGGFMGKGWLENEAAAQESINKAGTFRRSCLKILVSKVSPVLAGIVGYIDTNDNLDILWDGSEWKKTFWLQFLHTKEAIQLQFSDLQSPTRQSDLGEIFVMMKGFENHPFKCQIPFSWVIIEIVSDILKQALPEEHVEMESRLKGYARVVMDSTLGQLLDQLVRQNCGNMDQQTLFLTEFMQGYVHDILQMSYNPQADKELQLVHQSVMVKTKQMCEETGSHGNLVMTLLCVHFAFDTLATRLSYFRSINNIWPECSAAIADVMEKKPDHYIFADQELTFSALCLLIDNLAPKPSELDDPTKRIVWLNRVHSYRPVIERVFGLVVEDHYPHGVFSETAIRKAKATWSRVVVVKLFLEDVCVTVGEDKFTIKHCMPLWKLMGEESNMKELKSLNAVEKFLKSCNAKAMKEYLGAISLCCECECELEGPPISLPCRDVLCDKCYKGLKALNGHECPKCKEEFGQNWEAEKIEEGSIELERLAGYQKRCNTFFMDMVSQLCFADKTPPSQPVVEKLLAYITCISSKTTVKFTKAMTIFDTGIDPNPVFRSFLLQLLMRTSEHSVTEHLDTYLTTAEEFMKGDSNNDLIELSLLVIQCQEDTVVQMVVGSDETKCQKAMRALQDANIAIMEEGLTTVKLYGIANARMGLSVASAYLANIGKNKIDPNTIEEPVKLLLEEARKLCEAMEWPKRFVVKHLCRCYGMDIYQTLCQSEAKFLQWVDIGTEQNVSDRYIACGEQYKKIRETVTNVVLGEDVSLLEAEIQEQNTKGSVLEIIVDLALHREITCSNFKPRALRNGNEKTMKSIVDFVQDNQDIKDKDLKIKLIHNQVSLRHLVTAEGTDLRHQGLQCLIVHYMTVMKNLEGNRTLLHPLLCLIRNPHSMGKMFLPTMPQDELEEISEALREKGWDGGTLYKCPNGHPYAIGNCGQAMEESKCRDCGLTIGGQKHTLRTDNTPIGSNFEMKYGHVLGTVTSRGPPRQMRKLSPAFCSFERLLLHMSMYIGAAEHKQDIRVLIKPAIAAEHVEDFIWGHMQKDIDDLQHVLTRSTDDILLFMHILVHSIFEKDTEGNNIQQTELQSNAERRKWEDHFSVVYLQNVYKDFDELVKNYNHLIAQDERLGGNALLCLMHEIGNQRGTNDVKLLQEIPRVWRYRTPISVEHLKQEFTTAGKVGIGVLEQFLKEDEMLKALKYVPSILRLQGSLMQKYKRKLDKAEGNTILLKQIVKDMAAGPETESMIKDFQHVWDLVRDVLALYMCPTEVGGMFVSAEYTNRSITGDTPLSVLLPTDKEAGLCSYAMLDLLFRRQNDFIDKYLNKAKRKLTSVACESPAAVTAAHLISYDHENDILPLVLANCQYTFEMGKGTKIEYDFVGLERQLIDRLLFAKARIDVGPTLQIEQMVYRTEFTNNAVFEKLSEKVPQVALTTAAKLQICDELRAYPDVCRSLDNLDIVISFMKTTGGQPESNLYEFMAKTLQMEEPMKSQKARQVCEFQHAKALWLLMSLQKSKLSIELFEHTQDPFESLLEEFRGDLPEDVTAEFTDYMKHLSIEKLSQLLEALHEFLLLKVAVRENRDAEDFMDTTDQRIGENLIAYVDAANPPPTLDTEILYTFPGGVLYKHSASAWITAYKTLNQKLTGQRRN